MKQGPFINHISHPYYYHDISTTTNNMMCQFNLHISQALQENEHYLLCSCKTKIYICSKLMMSVQYNGHFGISHIW